MAKRSNAVLVAVLSVVLGLLFGVVLMLIFGYNPIEAYKALWQGAVGTPFALGQTIRAATPLICTGLGFSVAYTAGFFNIGLAGQALWGWLVSIMVALAMPEAPGYVVIPVAVLTGMLAGAIWAGIAGLLKAYFNASEVIVTIMLNYVAVYINDHMVRNVLTDRADATPFISEQANLRIEWLSQLTNHSTIHGGIFLALIAVFVVHYLMNYTTLGFELKAVGQNQHAANYAGMNSKRNIILAMVISGALAGLGGVMNGLGEFRNIFLTNGVAPAIGFDGMSVALLGGLSPIGTVLASLLFGGMQTGSSTISLRAGVPQEIVDIVMAAIIFFVGANYIIRYFIDRREAQRLTVNQEGGQQP